MPWFSVLKKPCPRQLSSASYRLNAKFLILSKLLEKHFMQQISFMSLVSLFSHVLTSLPFERRNVWIQHSAIYCSPWRESKPASFMLVWPQKTHTWAGWSQLDCPLSNSTRPLDAGSHSGVSHYGIEVFLFWISQTHKLLCEKSCAAVSFKRWQRLQCSKNHFGSSLGSARATTPADCTYALELDDFWSALALPMTFVFTWPTHSD